VPNPFGEGFEDFKIPDGLAVDEETPAGGATPVEADGFDGFSLDEDFLKTSLDSTAGVGDEFHIPGFSDFTSGAARAGVSEIPSGGGKPQKKEIPLQITDSDFNEFLSILASYPLNLKIAAEEFLAGDVGTEVQKMEFVHHVIERTSARKLAHSLENYLNRSIPIPKDYEKKSVEDYEREKSSLKYVFMNRILPAAVLFTIVAVLSFCTAYLSYQFIYRPLAAESLYSRGYAAIEDSRYTQSLELFDQAVQKWDKKSWYFKYARAFRAKKQYTNAELLYTRILDHFKNDKAGGLEYAEMLRTELRNFEKAEMILKRRLLDNFVNDKDCLILLGDTYLDWAEEEPEKYEDARHTYASLIELYGPQDPFLARMMRYFIRTNNLKEVLPLKEHFMSKRAKIGAPDLVELSQYLLEKRYLPSPGDSQELIDKIEDVRDLLERAVDSDGTSPEAHYNMGRFYRFNYKDTPATAALTEALKQFDKASIMSPKRVMAHVDTYRLLGEICRDDNEFLKAQAFYGDGITLYETQRDNRSVRPDPRVGVLYADFADIDYFISNDLDGALNNYRKSIDELNDTPSVRYRIGYIMYQKQNYEAAMDAFSRSHSEMPDDRNVLYGYGNTLVRRGDYYAAQGYYERLMDLLEAERIRKGIVLPQARVDHGAFVEEYMRTANNLGVILDHLARRTGDSRKKARSLDLFAESGRAWDTLTRNPETMIRAQGVNLAYLNIQTVTHPRSGYESEIFADIPRTLEGEKVLQQRSDQ
jgi:tetratricopeptide (TPR) repeat protein